MLSCTSSPSHTGPLLLAVGVAGISLITTVVLPASLSHPSTVTVTVYIPDSVVVGFCIVEKSTPSFCQAYEASATVLAVSCTTSPSQAGPSLVAVGAAGMSNIATVAEPAGLVHPSTVIVNS